MEADLTDLIGTVQDTHFHALLNRLLGPETATGRQYRDAPAAKHYHQAYEHGLLEHSLTVAQAVSAVSAIFPGIDRDLAVTGALLHDIGKLDTYAVADDAIDFTSAGRLQGEIPLGYYRVRTEIDTMGDVPPARAQELLHVVLSHHGSLQHGSPVVPTTREATLVHFMDNLGGRLGSFDRLEQTLEAGTQWSAYDRALGSAAHFPAAVTPPADAQSEAA
ncbi:MAG: HD domain-containing protein [Solirubrobacteraceae bacterium]|nr:HD domain-containing protein [Solirubrobacteraceae bacterium]